ncbi:MAG TPA: polysaccharide deacetylase [Candidatus Micrarchaeia archaeon]|nr:polysaccharide deacetylase [Candidatus Micrarchaeia archaeon]
MRLPPGTASACAVTFDFDAEEVWLGEDPANADRPGVLSQGRYGARVAVPLILEELRRAEVLSTFFVPGRVAERHPERVEAIVAQGHELAHHGYRHVSPTRLSADQEADEFGRALAVLQRFQPVIRGYRSPSWDFSPHTLRILAAHRIVYSSNLMDDIRPYRHPDHPVVELPVHWTLDDAPHFWFAGDVWSKSISAPDRVAQIWEGELQGIRELGGACILTMHPQIIGRPSRLPLLGRFIARARASGDVWLATCADIAAAVP